jgi:hypothetical protein
MARPTVPSACRDILKRWFNCHMNTGVKSMKIRRVVTGHNAAGKAVFVSDTEIGAPAYGIMPGSFFHKLWTADVPPKFPDDGKEPGGTGFFPPNGGYRFMMMTLPPHDAVNIVGDKRTLAAEAKAGLPGLIEHMERGGGMHTTDTIDFEYILSGEVDLILDDGAKVTLRAGDTVVQNGTRHSWQNHGTVPCEIVVFVLGVERNPSGMDLARASAEKK